MTSKWMTRLCQGVLWLAALRAFPPMQALESYNLTQVMDMIKAGGHGIE